MAPQTLLVVFLGVAVIVEGGVFPLTSPDNKIHTGTETDISKFPWMVAVLRNNNAHCGGAIISQDWVLTAAHCTDWRTPKSMLKLRVGSTIYHTGGQEYLVEKVENHPKYDPALKHNDISIIKTARPITLGGSVATVKLPTTSTPSLSPSTTLTVSGWGRTELGKPSDALKAAKVVVLDFQRCVHQYPQSIFYESFQICADFGDGITCPGDSGSAVVTDDVIVGVVSLGAVVRDENGKKDRCPGVGPSIFTRVAFFRDWIRQVANV